MMIAAKEIVNHTVRLELPSKDKSSGEAHHGSLDEPGSPTRTTCKKSDISLVLNKDGPEESRRDDGELLVRHGAPITAAAAAADTIPVETALDGGNNDGTSADGQPTDEGDASLKRKRKIIRSLFDTVQRVLKTDARHVSPFRFTEELAWTEVYGPLYRSLQQEDPPDISILLGALVEKQQFKVRCTLLSTIHQAVVANVAGDGHAVARALLEYSESTFKANGEKVVEGGTGDDVRKATGDKEPINEARDLGLWLSACGSLLRQRCLAEQEEFSLWQACWKLLPNPQALLLLVELAMVLKNPLILRHICRFLLATKDSDLIPDVLQLLSLQLYQTSDPLAAKAIIYQALHQERYFSECLHCWRQMSVCSKPDLELFVEVIVLRRLRSKTNVEDCLEYLAEIAKPTLIYVNFDCDTLSSNLWESIVTELAKTAFEGSRECDDRARISETMTPHDAIPTASMRGAVVTVALDKQARNHMNTLAFEILANAVHGLSQLANGCSHLPTTSILSNSGPVEVLDDSDVFGRKQRKVALQRVCEAFNTGEKGKFMEAVMTEGLASSTDDAKTVAGIIHEARGFDKQKLGVYLSQGPDKDFPFQASVRKEYTARISFGDLSFSNALRKFLSNFRLPGEAQCIDRLMESFSEELHKQQVGSSLFKNADAIYVLAFSTIMLNTDLHNPTIRSDLRMTKEQFIKNNRGINAGDDLPEDFLAALYADIKGQELHVFRGLDRFMEKGDEVFDIAWNDAMAQPYQSVVSMTLSRPQASELLGEMFRLLGDLSISSILGLFKKSWDDRVVYQALQTLEEVIRLSAMFHQSKFVDKVLHSLLSCGYDYASRCTVFDSLCNSDAVSVETARGVSSNDSLQDEDETLNDQTENCIPFGLLHSNSEEQTDEPTGSAQHRGLLALDRSFFLLSRHSTAIESAWPLFVDCLSLLRDLKVLPSGMSNLDDFADSDGNVLPLSSFAKSSQKRFEDHQKLLSGKGNAKTKGWFRSFFRNKKGSDMLDMDGEDPNSRQKVELSSQGKALVGIAIACDVEKIVQFATSCHPETTVQLLLDSLDAYPFEKSPKDEQHAVFAIELAARALLSNQTRSAETYLPFLSKFESILCRMAETEKDNVPAPFVIERIVVTILRSCIHLYEFNELRPHLRASLQLLIMTLPRPFVQAICDRMACGLAIILRASFQHFQSQEWSFMGDTLDVLANYALSRVFVFDGIASTVEYALTDTHREPKPDLCLEGCGVLSRILTRFVLGFYQSDITLIVPSMLCLEKVYRRKVEALLVQSEQPCQDINSAVPDLDFWQNMAVAVYSVCRSHDADISHEGLECFQRVVLRSAADQVPGNKWTAILFLMVNKQPPLTAEVSRANTFALLGQILTSTVATLSHEAELREDLEDFVNQYAGLAEENFQQSRRGNLYKGTLQTLTYVANHLVSAEWSGDADFGRWASEVLLKELEQVGGGGGGDHVKPATTVNAKEEEDVSEISDSAAESEAD